MNKIDKLAKTLQAAEEHDEKKKTSAYDTSAKVVRVEGNTAWVNIPGGVDQTPATMVVNAKVGEDVRVRVSNGKAYVTGNATSPPTDDSLAEKAESNALRAQNAADTASAQATIAKKSADSAVKDAGTAKKSADSAVKDASRAYNAAESAQASATAAATAAETAQASADTAYEQAVSATNSANGALTQLSTVESVVDTLTWIAEHSTFVLTDDTSVVSGKTYYMPHKNLMMSWAGSGTVYGVTFTVNSDKSVTVNGTATADASRSVGQNPYYENTRDVILTGCPAGGSEDTYYLEADKHKDTGNGASYTQSSHSAPDYDVWIVIKAGTTVDNLTFYPMIRYAEDGYSDYIKDTGTTDEYYIVSHPAGNPNTRGYYELNTDDAVKTYVQSHLSLTNQGLYVLNDSSGWKVLIKNTGVEIQNETGNAVADYGASVRIGLQTLGHIILSSTGLEVFDGSSNSLANFGSTVRIGQDAVDKSRVEIHSDGLNVLHKGLVAGVETDFDMFDVAYDGTSGNYYYTLGSRGYTASAYNTSKTYLVGDVCEYNGSLYVCKSSTSGAWDSSKWAYAIGKYSLTHGMTNFACGPNSFASGAVNRAIGAQSHAEGAASIAAGAYSHAEGEAFCEAIGEASHAEGYASRASGNYSHAEGNGSVAVGNASHASGDHLVAGYDNQTAIGMYNNTKQSDLFEIGNGSSSTRDNAFEVDSSGNVNIHSGAKYKIDGSNLSASDVGAAASGHTHDDRYYTETEVDTKLNTKLSLIAATSIPENSDLNSTTYCAVGSYAHTLNSTVTTITNRPSGCSEAFMLNVYNPLSNSTGSSGNWIYRLQELMTYTGSRTWARLCSTDGSGQWSYGGWVETLKSNKLYKRTASGGLDWGDGSTSEMVMTKGSIAFWNGSYDGSSSNLSRCTNGVILGSNGFSRVGQNFTCTAASVAANGGTYTVSGTMTKSGYFPVALVGVDTSLPAGLALRRYYMTASSAGSCSLTAGYTNTTASAISVTTSAVVAFYVMWMKIS